MRELGIGVGWQHPFFLPILSRITIHEDSTVSTASVSINGKIKINKVWAGKLPDNELVGVLFHEILHLMMNHSQRQESRNAMGVTDDGQMIPMWNVAADMAINTVLHNIGITLPKGAVYPPTGLEDLNAEQLYEYLVKNTPEGGTCGAGGGVTSGCSLDPCEGMSSDEIDTYTEEWEKVAAQSRSLSSGTDVGNKLAQLFNRREALRWDTLCRSAIARAVSIHGRDTQTWSRRSRRSTGNIIFPGWKATKATVCGVIDSSGSVSDEAISRAIDQLQRISDVAEARLYIVVHDYEVQFHGWVNGKDRASLQRTIRGRGGTDFNRAYSTVYTVPKRFDIMVHLTDGECFGEWPSRPPNVQRLIVALLGECNPLEPPVGSTVVKVNL
jgi:predicted metal-dependent peptidase